MLQDDLRQAHSLPSIQNTCTLELHPHLYSTHTLERNPSSPQNLEYIHTPEPVPYITSLESLAESTPINMDRATQLSYAVAIIGLAAVIVSAIISRAAIAVFAVLYLAAIDVLPVVGVAAIALFAIANGNSIVNSQNVHDTSAQTDANANVTLPHEPIVTNNERALVLHKSTNRDGMLALPWHMRDTNAVPKVSVLVSVLAFAHIFQNDTCIAQPHKALHDRLLIDGRTDNGLQQESGVAEDAHGDELALLQVSIVEMGETSEVGVSMRVYIPSLTHSFQADGNLRLATGACRPSHFGPAVRRSE